MPSAAAAPGVPERLTEIHELITRLDSEIDFLTWELRPAALDDLGLIATLGNFVNEWSKNYGIRAEFHSRLRDHERFGFEIETNLYRIAQEALNNVHKHAHAARVGVMVERRHGHVVLVVEDDGQGFVETDPSPSNRAAKEIGLVGMRELHRIPRWPSSDRDCSGQRHERDCRGAHCDAG